MKKSNRIRRVGVGQVSRLEASTDPRQAPDCRLKMPFLSRRTRGQAAVIIALSSIVLVAAVGLAVDGGSMYTERRAAQNGSDGAAIAGTKLFLKQYEAALQDPSNNGDVPGTADQEAQIKSTLNQYAAANGIVSSSVEAYFVDGKKHIVTVQANGNGGNPCGWAPGLPPCHVGENGEVPWTLGAIGITVNGRAETGAYFARILGWSTISATARATAFVEVTNTTSDVSLLPLGLFTSTLDINQIQFGQTYVLIDGDTTQGGGNWGWVDFNGLGGSATVAKAWLSCGFNPSVTSSNWSTWCPAYANANGYGPTQHYRSTINPDPSIFPPEATWVKVPYIQYGYQAAGWWLKSSSGATNSACQTLYDHIYDASTDTPDGLGMYLYFPMFDATYDNGNQGLVYHLRIIASFFLRKPTGNPRDPGQDISCRPITPPTATPCALCPTPTPGSGGGGGNVKWFIQGKAKNFYDNTSSGQIGDIRHAYGRTVVLDR